MKICLVLAVVVSTNALQHSAMWSLNDADQGGGWATLTFDVANTTQIDTNYKNGIRKMRGVCWPSIECSYLHPIGAACCIYGSNARVRTRARARAMPPRFESDLSSCIRQHSKPNVLINFTPFPSSISKRQSAPTDPVRCACGTLSAHVP